MPIANRSYHGAEATIDELRTHLLGPVSLCVHTPDEARLVIVIVVAIPPFDTSADPILFAFVASAAVKLAGHLQLAVGLEAGRHATPEYAVAGRDARDVTHPDSRVHTV